jgi:excisionase family DNA binding protein
MNIDPDEVLLTGTVNSIYLTAQEAAAYLRTTRGTVYNLVWRGVLPRRRGKLLFTRDELDSYLNGEARKPLHEIRSQKSSPRR